MANGSNSIQELNAKSILIEEIYWFLAFGIGILIEIIDVRIVDVNQPSYLSRKPTSIIKSVENEKIKVFGALLRAKKALYSFLVVSCEGLLGKKGNVFLKRLSHCPYTLLRL